MRRIYLLHGLMGTAYAHFGVQIRRWHDDGPVPVDLPGHGRCRLDAAPSYSEQAMQYVERILGRLGPGDVVAASYLGGPIAVSIAARRPDLVRSLVLCGTALPPDPKYVYSALRVFEKIAPPHSELSAAYDNLHGTRWRQTLRHFAADPGLVAAMSEVNTSRLASLGLPVLICNGDLKQVERESVERLVSEERDIEGRVVAGTGHLPSVDRPERFAEIVEEWRARSGRPMLAGRHARS
ncbi:alpha/beta fold hydrolase [Kocuria sp. CPCC 205297]|uniref:alpha/beta fold hydrolase n=1 Tax=Kocuria sp. CPCC 205297 TaxID=3073558 RepID=UPI0034D5B1E6